MSKLTALRKPAHAVADVRFEFAPSGVAILSVYHGKNKLLRKSIVTERESLVVGARCCRFAAF
jgi:hypothetical protein